MCPLRVVPEVLCIATDAHRHTGPLSTAQIISRMRTPSFLNKRGDPAAMAVWEVLALLVALRTWTSEHVHGQPCGLPGRATLKLVSRARLVNRVVQQVAMDFAWERPSRMS
eukprot:1595133-Amphidinium_carterae.2